MKRDAKPGWEVRFGNWMMRRRWTVLAVTLTIAVLLGAGVSRLGFSNNYRVFFGDDNPQLLAFEQLENVYAKQDNILFVVAPRGGDAFSPEHLAVVEDLTKRAWQLPFARRVDSVTNFQNAWSEEDDLVVEDLIQDPASRSETELAAALQVALQEPQLSRRLVSPTAHVTGVNVTLELPGKSPFEVVEAAQAARALAAEFEKANQNLAIHVTGVAMLNNAFAENARQDMMTLAPLMFVAMIVVIGLLLRSMVGAVSTLAVISISTAVGMGLAGWLGIKITPASSVAPTMIMTLAVADSIHILVTMLAGMRRGLSKQEAIVESLRVNLQPVIITSLTTAIGFLSLNLSDAPPFRDLGNIAAMGVSAALVYSAIFLPALMAVLPIRQPGRAASGNWGMGMLANLVTRRSRPLLWGSLAVVLAVAAFIPQNELNDEFVKYFDPSVQFRQDTDFTTENLTGIYQIDFSIGAGESGGISEPAYLRKLDEFETWLREQPGVLQVSSLSYVMKRLNKNMHGDDPAYFAIPESRELAAQYLLLYEMSLPFGLDLNNQINVDKSAARLSVTVADVSTSEIRRLGESAESWLEANAPESMAAHATGPIVMFSYISERNAKSMVFGTVLALILISGCLVVALRSTRYGLLSLVPNLIPAVLTFGFWGLLVGQINLGLANVLAMSLGIVADDTVHFLSKYLRARRERGLSTEDAVHYAFTSVGKALVITSIILVTGFFVMTRSTFALNSNMGWFTLITISVALVADFLLLPALLVRLDARREAKQALASGGVALAPNAS